ncbi:MAG: putative acyl-CoA dehydrogenase [Amycolatopsis sp.]|uniref:acyl-CoA dehydrogenase family protein n=1 Tax=Amycolatopsis sp. TaxID=37632 RepID=UPI002611167F|nr:acyl-CoA dehydrogenase family protein [Amycolatopsis sp.]MCU1679963.1 putative acyl-CoA dehydrogenase [Amycolatopsis sp.]
MSPLAPADVPRTQDHMWHDLGIPEEIVALRGEVRATVTEKVAPYAREIGSREESVDSFPWKAFRGLADSGTFAIPFGSDFGRGLAHPLLGTCTATEEIAYHSSSMAGVYDGQCILVPKALSFASDELRARVIPGLISGELVFSFATTEPDASSDLSVESMRTTATETADNFVLNGRKRWITNSAVADWAAVLCRSGGSMTMILVDLKHSDGVRIGKPDLKLGHRGQLTSDIVFDNVLVPKGNVLGAVGKGLSVSLACLTYGRIGIAAAGVGVAQAALDLAVARLRSRHLFGKPLGAMQHWQYRLAERATELECARTLYQKAALRVDAGERAPEPEAAMAKAYATRLAADMARDAIQVYGGYGFAREVSETGETFRLEELYRDSKILEIFEGANEIQHWLVARQLIGRDVTG